MIQAFKQLLSIESVAGAGNASYPYGEGPAKALEYVLSLCQQLGMRTKNADCRYGYAEIGQGAELIGILCHLDVVPAGNGWTYPPFAGTETNGRIYGRGSIDDKGPAIASIFAMKDILDAGIPLNKRIRILFGQTEEAGIWKDLDAYKTEEEVPAYGFTPDGEFPAICGEKGILAVRVSMPLEKSGLLEIRGGNSLNMVPDWCTAKTTAGTYETSGIAAHGSLPWQGENAITRMMEQLAAAEGGACFFAGMYMDCIGRDLHGRSAGCGFSDAISGALSLNAGKIAVEDGKVCLWLDIRYPVTTPGEAVEAALRNRFAAYGASVEIIHRMDPIYIDQNEPLIRALTAAYSEATGDTSPALVIGGGTYARAMKRIVAFGPQLPGQENTEHKPNEYISISHLNALRTIYAKALQNLLAL